MNIPLPVAVQWLQALGPTIVAALVGVVAWRQWLTARAKLKLDLFDKRFAAFKAISDAVFQHQWTSAAAKASTTSIFEAKQQCQFLFGGDVNEIVSDLARLSFEIKAAVELRDDPGMAGNPDIVHKQLLATQDNPGKMIALVEELRRRVQPYMSME